MNIKINKSKQLLSFIIVILIFNTFNSCKDDIINLKGVDDSNYKIHAGSAIVLGEDGKNKSSNFDFHKEGNYKVSIQLNNPLTQNSSVTFIYDESLIQAYNAKNGTSYLGYPKDLIQFENEGLLNIESGKKTTKSLSLTIKENKNANPSDTFVLPIKAKGTHFENNDNLEFILFIKDLTKLTSGAKNNGLKVFSIIEANNVNPLIHLAFTLKNSGKPLFDYVVLFSSNINYNKETGKVYLSHNENNNHILQNRDKYIKPLQDRGIKVALSILGNGDFSGIANLSDETIKYFAQDIKKTCEIYGLDGVFYDDEYSNYISPPPPGFKEPSRQRAAKLMYEVKRIMPSTINMAYVYSSTKDFGTEFGKFNGIEEAQAGEYVDYGIHDYFSGYDLSNNYPGLPKSGMIMYPSEHARNHFESSDNLQSIVNNKYGGTMIFSLNPNADNFLTKQLPNLQNIAKIFYNEELIYDKSKAPKKDW